MIRHNYPGEELVADLMPVQQRVLNDCGDFGVVQEAVPVALIYKLFYSPPEGNGA